jgi:hypothetical protein
MKKSVKKELILESIIFSLCNISIILFYNYNILLVGLLIICWLIGLKFWHKKQDFLFYIIGATVGSITEIICINLGGVWQYVNPTFLGIPIWLPFGWGVATMLIKRISETFVKIEMR